jgi:hypothetical protein
LLTPLISNKIEPALIGLIFSVGEPFPRPILTSRGFRVNGQNGLHLTIKKFFFFIILFKDFIVAFNCSTVKLAKDKDFKPISPQ